MWVLDMVTLAARGLGRRIVFSEAFRLMGTSGIDSLLRTVDVMTLKLLSINRSSIRKTLFTVSFGLSGVDA